MAKIVNRTLTPKQKKVLEFIAKFTKENGYAPSLAETASNFKLRAISTVHQYVESLKNKGYLKKEENQPRGIELNTVKNRTEITNIPLLGIIAAGQPIEAIRNDEIIEVSKSQLPVDGDFYALKVAGDSMINEGIFDGDTVIVRYQETLFDGEVGVALLPEGEVTLKKIYKERDRFRLQPSNPELKPIFVKELTVQGKVVSIIRNVFEKKDKDNKEFTTETINYIEETDAAYRKSLGQYFTPESVREALIKRLSRSIKNPKILDPACGTGEFLLTAKKYFPDAELHGWDIDKKLVDVAKVVTPTAHLSTANSLLDCGYDKFDFVIGNPPYFEFQPDAKVKEKFRSVIGGRPNIFGLFIYQGLRWLKNGGYLAYVVPPSMNNGAYFARLRDFIIRNANIEYIEILKDSRIFRDALQSTMLVVLRKGANRGDYIFKKNGIVIFSENAKDLLRIFRSAITLRELGYSVKTGRVVWNQNKQLLTNNQNEGTLLIWAHNIDEKELSLKLQVLNPKKPQYIKRRDCDIGPAIVVNRITGSVSSTKLRAAIVPAGTKFFAENHVNVVFPPKYDGKGNSITLESIAEQISSPEKSGTMKNITGNTQISKTELENLFPIKVTF